MIDALAKFLVDSYYGGKRLLRDIGINLRDTVARPIADIPPKKLKISNRAHKVSLFSRQLASMASSGVQIIQSLDVLSEQEQDPKFQYALSSIATQMATGYMMSKAISNYPKIFPKVFPYLIQTGENTGQLSKVLTELADMLEAEENMMKRVRGAISYPIFILILTMVLTLIIFTTVLPSFADFYKGMELELPLITKTLMGLTAMVTSGWFWLAAFLIAGTLFGVGHQMWKSQNLRLFVNSVILKVPLFGAIIGYTGLTRFCWVLEITLESGVDIIRSLRLAALASGSEILQVDSRRLMDGVQSGDRLTEMMQVRPQTYPNFLTQMVMMGEETSSLSDACGRSADWFSELVEHNLEAFHAALEPIMMVLVSLIVGGIVVAVFLPLYGILEKLA